MTIKVKHSGKPTFDEMNALGALFNQEKLAEAEVLAIGMTQQYPKHVFGWKALGAVRKNQHKLQGAVDAFEVAAQISAKDGEVQHNLGNCYFDLGDDSKAVLHYQKAVKLEPDLALAYFNLANSLRRQNKFSDAQENYKKAIKLEPENSLFYVKLADLYYELKMFDDAIQYFQQAIKLAPNDAVLYVSLGASFKALLQYDAAKKAYEKALGLNPDYALVYSNLADMYNEMGRFDEAEIYCRHAIQVAPEFAKAYSNLAMALQNLARFDEAIAAFHQALRLDPTDIATLSNFSLMLIAHNQFTHAEAYQKRAIELNPDFVAAYINLAQNYIYQGRIDEAETCYLHALNIQPDHILAKSGLLFAMNYSAKYSLADRLTQANEYNDMVMVQVKTVFTSWLNTNPSKRLRVGMVSGDLRQHAVAYFLDNLLRFFDTNKIELVAYSTDAREDAMTARLRHHVAAWHSLVGLNDEDAAQKIHQDGVQILIDLSGHSAGNRLPIFARKPAPVQVSWLGYFATTGLTAMDYFIADPVGVPAENRGHFVETIKYLPDTRLCFSTPDVDVAVSPLPALTNQYITFGSFQNTAKVGDEVLMLWAQVLKAVPNARLRLQSKALGDEEVSAKILERLVNCGIDPNVVTMHGFISRQGYLEAHAEIDMILDTFPFNGGTTTCEALWMGVPTLTIAGDTLIARQGASMLTAAGLGDWVASNASDFLDKAVSFARDTNQLAGLRAKLRAQVVASPLFDGQLFARNMEQALLEMWQECGFGIVNEGEMKEPHVEVQYQPLTKEAYEQTLRDNFKRKVYVVSATRYSENDFWYKSALGLSLQKQLRQDTRLSANIAFENSRGLSEVFNENIKLADDDAIIVFVHDDVWIDELNLADAVIQGLEHFDVIGVAGNKRRVPNQPAWPFIDTHFTWDERSNLSGRVAHGQQAFGAVSDFGDVPAECELMDGVFLAAKKSTLVAKDVQFDPQFDFHFYDLDFCRTARQAGLRLGTWLVRLTHQSGGAFGSPQWLKKYEQYLNKWELAPSDDGELQKAMNDVLQMAIEHQQAGQLEQAAILYQEILKIQPEHAEANHNLGVIEAHTKDVVPAVLRLERAVQAAPGNEQYWVSYIDALMQSGATESVIDALALGQQYGLKPETAQALAAEFVSEMESKDHATDTYLPLPTAAPQNDYYITTLIPAYKTQYLGQLLYGLVTQTFKKFKVIISDDSPNNEVTEVINSAEYAVFREHLAIEVVDGPKKGGFPNIFNLVRNYAHQAAFFHILMDDDVIYPSFYESHMREHSKVSANVSVSARWNANEAGQPYATPMDHETSQYFSETFTAQSISKAVIPSCNNKLGEWSHAVFRNAAAAVILKPSINDVSYFGLDDIGSFISATESLPGIWIPAPLGVFRESPNQNTGKNENTTIKCAHYSWISLAIAASEHDWISSGEAWDCISLITNSIRARYGNDELGIRMLSILDQHHDLTPDFKGAYLDVWSDYLQKIKLQDILDGDLSIKLL